MFFNKKWTITGDSQCGPNRDHNEDSIVFKTVKSGYSFAVVCDGVGGNNAGEVASSMACTHLSEMLSQQKQWERNSIKNIIRQTHNTLISHATNNPNTEGMATTLVMAIQQGKQAIIAWAGDSRAYLLSADKTLQQISDDHSFVSEKVAQGVLSKQEAEKHPMASMITSCLGGTEKSLRHIGFKIIDFEKGQKLILMSDGIYSAVSPEEIISNAAQAEDLTACAIENNTSDNCSAVVITR